MNRSAAHAKHSSGSEKHQSTLGAAGAWLLASGIQNEDGGVARYFDAPAARYRAVSTEITGYVASALVYLYQATGNPVYLERARKTARFLTDHSWERGLQIFPFEHPSPSADSDHHAYFFDSGIIIRGLLAVYRHTRDEQILDVSWAAARKMTEDFHSGRDYHPVICLPRKSPLDRDERWSRSSGCYQLKAATSWWEVAKITGDNKLREAFLEMLEVALARHEEFLPGAPKANLVMDRLHAYCYFLEGLLVVQDRKECCEAYRSGIRLVESYLREIAPSFSRCDVYAQLLRARINGELLGVCPIDMTSADQEAVTLMTFHLSDPDPRIDGGFAFGRRDGKLVMHVNPWATGFALQALDMWQRLQAGHVEFCPELLV